MKGTHQYKRRTYDEARELAMAAVRDQIRDHVPANVIEEMRGVAIETGGVGHGIADWTSLVGSLPDPRMHYEFEVYEPSDEHPYVKRYLFRALASRDRDVDSVWIMWLPPVREYPPLPSEPKHDIPEGHVFLHD